MSAACWVVDIAKKGKEQQSGNVLYIADYKLKHTKADEEASGDAKMPDAFNEKLPRCPE